MVKKRGISLIVLVITIIVIILLVTAVILGLAKNNPRDSAVKAKFMANFTNVEESVGIYAMSRLSAENTSYELPLGEKITLTEKENIKKDVPTLAVKVAELNPGKTIDNIDLYRIDPTLIGAENLYSIKTKGYLIDASTRQVYDYSGEYFEDARWHTLDSGVKDSDLPDIVDDVIDIWDGWITLSLYYPSNSTERKWRLGEPGEVRESENLVWQDYTGPITVRLTDVENIWISYIVDNKKVIIPPVGKVLVDIEPDTKAPVDSVKVKITYDDNATKKKYKVGNSGWMEYTGEFTVTSNVVIEARAEKPDNVYDTNGNLIKERKAVGTDAYYVGNIKEKQEEILYAPTIKRMDARDSNEKASVKITYPEDAVKKVYKVNYGIEQNYTEDISVTNWGTHIQAYYYDANGKKSRTSSIYIDETPTDPEDGNLTPPTLSKVNARNESEVAGVQVTYPENAVTKQYRVNYGAWQTYTDVIAIPQYNTYVQARYYDENSKMSPIRGIYIQEGRTDGPPPPENLNPVAPTINITPTTLTDNVQVSVTAPANADRIYIRIGDGKYVPYTTSLTLTSNTWVYAYYITYDGEISYTARKRVSNIKTLNNPYVAIDAVPDNYSRHVSKVKITLKYSDADTVEYSKNGIEYTAYTGEFEVTENCTIYARATNANGVATDKEYITNIGDKPPAKPASLAVNISVNPEPAVTNVAVDKVKVSIEYDNKATEKYYKIGRNGMLIPYTGEFEVTNNCTIYAYAINTTSNGNDTKIIDNIVDGISEPVITGSPKNTIQSTKTKITIEYDKNATVKQYKINSNGQLRNYAGTFEVTENSVIYAYSKNAKGQASSSTYEVTNIVPPPPVLVIDYGKYFLLKLNYPEQSTTREYKWKVDGTWKPYDSQGILLIKPEYRNEILNADGNIIIKIKDENGQEKTFTGDYYLLDLSPSEINENLFMRWDRVTPSAPQIIPSTSEPTRSLTAQIQYESYLVKKEYKVLNPDGSVKQDWTEYKGPISVDVNNTVIYARGQDDAEVWSNQAVKKITNIDETSPEIHLTADLEKIARNVQIKVSVTDDVKVQKVKWAAGIQGESYFATGGTEINNNSVVKITGNGYYTFYAEDGVGNKQVYTLNIENIDLTPPAIDIQVTPETIVGISVQIIIDYGDSTIKQYKIGESNTTWTNYTTPITLTSNTVLANNWKNADGTVTIYAKGKDAVGNEKQETKKILNLDLDIPKAPVINSSAGYPVLTSYGVDFDATTIITYDNRTDIDNYYSVDNGITWLKYKGSFDYASGTIIAKSVKKDTRLEISISKTVAMPADALKQAAYDGNDGTRTGSGIMYIDSSMQGKAIRVRAYQQYFTGYINFLDSNGTAVGRLGANVDSAKDYIYIIPETAVKLSVGVTYVYEIQPSNEPTFSATNGYMLLHADPTKSIKTPYQMVSISYFPTSVQRLYRVGTTGEWKNYEDKAIWVNQSETIYAKGIDQYGNETRIISSYTVNVTDALKKEACDGNDSTRTGSGIMYIDSSMQGKAVRVRAYQQYFTGYINFLDSNGTVVGKLGANVDSAKDYIYTIPETAVKLSVGVTYVYEIQPSNEPTFSATNGYMLLHADSTKSIKTPYQMVSISYFPTSVQRLYRVGTTGEWKNYEDKAIWVNQGETIYAKGIDQYGIETRIISSYTANVTDALKKEAYDENDSTRTGAGIMYIDPSMQGKTVRVRAYQQYFTGYINFLDSNDTIVGRLGANVDSAKNYIYTIPETAVKLSVGVTYIYEIQLSN